MCAAAISDYTVEESGKKISSNSEDASLILLPTRKLISEVREKHPELCIVGFKAETNVSKDELIKSAGSLKDKCRLQLVVANDVGETGMGTDDNSVRIISDTEEEYVGGSKQIIARHIVKAVSKLVP
jgi:phosphopantothenoylcysteine decarboxylase/phosphopantothenate--cysteine ligase